MTFFLPDCVWDARCSQGLVAFIFFFINTTSSYIIHYFFYKKVKVAPTTYLPQKIFVCIYIYIFFFNLTYSRWTSSLPSCLWLLRIFPSLPGSRLNNFLSRCKFSTLTTRQPMVEFYLLASSALLQLVNQWLNFTYSRSHAFRHERTQVFANLTLVRIELTTSARRYFQHAHFIPIVGVGKRGEY